MNEDLVDRCCDIDHDRSWEARVPRVRAILKEVLRTLEIVTDGMDEAAHTRLADRGELKDLWLAMLHASPIGPNNFL